MSPRPQTSRYPPADGSNCWFLGRERGWSLLTDRPVRVPRASRASCSSAVKVTCDGSHTWHLRRLGLEKPRCHLGLTPPLEHLGGGGEFNAARLAPLQKFRHIHSPLPSVTLVNPSARPIHALGQLADRQAGLFANLLKRSQERQVGRSVNRIGGVWRLFSWCCPCHRDTLK